MTKASEIFTEIEQEAIILGAVVSMVDDMVNHSIFCPLGERRQATNLLPQTEQSLRQFGTLLRDFLSPVTGKGKVLPFGLHKPESSDRATDYTTLYIWPGSAKTPLSADTLTICSVS